MTVNCEKITLTNLKVRPDARKTTTFRTLQQQYGDGYMARRQDGVNPVNYVWSVSTPPLWIEDAQSFEAELIELGTAPFEWIPPNQQFSETYVVDPPEWSWSWESDQLASIAFQLKRWYQ